MYNGVIMCETEKEIKIKGYINNYLKEIQRHFDVSDKYMRILLYKIYKQKSPAAKIKILSKKCISMVKSFCKSKNKLKREDKKA